MFLKRPVLGWGLGTFPVVYPQFRSFSTNFFVNQAHNDYLQLLVEMGLLGFGTVSYTHLDVYKRQEVMILQSDLLALQVVKELALDRRPEFGGKTPDLPSCLLYTSRCV